MSLKEKSKFFLFKNLGQHFLTNEEILKFEAELLSPQDQIVLEIGAGDGRLTEHILNLGAKEVFVVEKDKRFVEFLRKKFSNLVNVIEDDFLNVEPFKVDKIIGNIPYNISSKILFKLKEWDFNLAILMFQDEFAKKMIAKPSKKNYGRLSVTSQLLFNVKYVRKVPASWFFPKPKVNSAIVKIEKKNFNLTGELEEFIRKLFSHKRKLLRSVLKDEKLLLTKIPENLLNRRIFSLSPEEVVNLFSLIQSQS